MGNVYVQKRGNVFQYQFQIASVDGKRKYKNKSGFSTRNEAFKEGVKAYIEYMNTGHAFALFYDKIIMKTYPYGLFGYFLKIKRYN